MHNYEWYSLVPALVTIIFSMITHRVALSLFLGITSGVVIISSGNFAELPNNFISYMIITFKDLERIEISLFIMFVGGLLELISVSGAYYTLAETVSKFLNTARRSRVATWLIGVMMFFDDYANVLIAGSSMKKINAMQKVSPALSAYIVDIVSEVASIALISTWAAYESSVIFDAYSKFGNQKSAIELLINSLPYHFYTFLGIFFAFLAAYSGKWLGACLDTQKIEDKSDKKMVIDGNVRLKHVLIPIFTLIFCSFSGIFIAGSVKLKMNNASEYGIFKILSCAPTIEVLLVSSVIASIICVLIMKKDQVLHHWDFSKIYFHGMISMFPAALIIMLSNGLAKISGNLGTGDFITNGITGMISVTIMPALIFIVSMAITIAVGISWSSMAIMMPVAFQMAFVMKVPELIPVLSGAIISGAISGAHLVPFSDKSVMTAAACKITPAYHVKTQVLHVTVTIFSSVAAYIILMKSGSALLSLITGAILIFGVHSIFSKPDKLYL
ncbi:MAG: Na+/H+ antiporter NhaC family protein [Candidatus Wallbacteria bacterium]